MSIRAIRGRTSVSYTHLDVYKRQERVLVVRHVVVVVVGVGEERAAGGEHVRRTDVRRRQLRLVRVLYHEHFLRLAAEVLAQLVAQISVGVAVAYYLHRLRRTRCV